MLGASSAPHELVKARDEDLVCGGVLHALADVVHGCGEGDPGDSVGGC